MDKIYYTWHDIERYVADIAVQIWRSDWKPDYIVGIHSGGSIPAVMLGKMMGIKTYTLDVRLRDGDGEGPESNCWMPEDVVDAKNILIIDDINDSGATLKWIRENWEKAVFKGDIAYWWHKRVKIAVLVNNLSSEETADYHSVEINKAEKDCWIVFPWEEWHKSKT